PGLPTYAQDYCLAGKTMGHKATDPFSFFGELRFVASVERGEKWKHHPFPRSLENISCNNYCTVFLHFFGNDSSGATSTIPDQSRRAEHWALGRYQHKRENKMKYHYKELGELCN